MILFKQLIKKKIINIAEAVEFIAELGGFIKNNRCPNAGFEIIKKGMNKFFIMHFTYCIMKEFIPGLSKGNDISYKLNSTMQIKGVKSGCDHVDSNP